MHLFLKRTSMRDTENATQATIENPVIPTNFLDFMDSILCQAGIESV
jgi:hypothetical protein